MGNFRKLLLATFVIFAALPGHAQDQNPTLTTESFKVDTRRINQFKIGSDKKNFGPLEFAGGLEMTANSRDFGAWSSIAISPDQSAFIGLLDSGFWIDGKIIRDNAGLAVGLNAHIQAITGKSGASIAAKWQSDAESIARKGDILAIGFERVHRIDTYKIEPDGSYRFLNTQVPDIPLYELRTNRGLEAIGFAPDDTALNGALVAITEKSLDKKGNIMGFVRNPDGSNFQFSVSRYDDFDITDMDFLPNGDLIILERRFNILSGVAMRLRYLKTSGIKAGATIDGPVLLEANMLYQIDNMEGLAITTDPDGTPRLTIISDDNHSLFQRNLLLEFRLTGKID